MKPTRFGIIGTAGRGGVYLDENHRPDEGYEIIAGADIDAEAGKTFQERFPQAAFYTDYRMLLANPDVDAVFIVTPDFLHREMAAAALDAGKDVCLEKPIALGMADAVDICRAAMRNRKKLYLAHNMRFFPIIRKMHSLIRSGIIGVPQALWCRHFINYGGDAYFRDWHSERKNTCGLLLQKGAHDIDIIHYLMGASTVQVSGMGMLSVYDKCRRRPDDGSAGKAIWEENNYPPEECEGFSPCIDVEDHNMIMMQLSSGAQACYMQCHYTPDNVRNYTIIGTRGRIENTGVSDKDKILVWNERRNHHSEPDAVFNVKPSPGTHSGADPLIMKDFREYIRFDRPASVNPVAALLSVMVGEKGHESMRGKGERLDIPPIPQDIMEYFCNGKPELLF